MAGRDLTLQPFLWRAEHLFPDKEIVSYGHDGITRYTYPELASRSRRLASALSEAGIDQGDRVASFAWNHHRHAEAYFGVPSMGAQLHTVNPLLPDDHIRYIIEDAGDRFVLVDPSLVEKLSTAIEGTAAGRNVEQYVVLGEDVPETSLEPVIDYESFRDEYGRDGFEWPTVSEDQPAGMCYTSGTTGKPKGVEYTQKMLWAHTMANISPQGHGTRESDTVLTLVPMFHVNAWGFPFEITAAGAGHVYAGESPDAEKIVRVIREEGVTLTCGVPTIWLNVLEYLETNSESVPSLERIFTGGSAIPRNVVETFDQTYDVEVTQGWGMTEIAGIGSTTFPTSEIRERGKEAIYDKTTTQGIIAPGLEFRVREDGTDVPWDGQSYGELHVRGPWVTTSYVQNPEANEKNFDGDWLKTGDIVAVDEDGYINIVDRVDDLIKSGGEWISSVEVENALMTHESVLEAAVIGAEHDYWDERPVAFVVSAAEASDEEAITEQLQETIERDYPKWWAPQKVFYVDRIPQTSTGKFDKKTLRTRYADGTLLDREEPPSDLVDN